MTSAIEMPVEQVCVPRESDSFVWSDTMLMGCIPMDETHREFVEIVGRLLQCNKSNAGSLLESLETHIVAHFELERTLMASTDFPAAACHNDEHDAVLGSLKGVRERLASSKAKFHDVRIFAEHLAEWFPGHADYLDSALSAWVSKKLYGGYPVVLRKGVARSLPPLGGD